MTRGSETGSRIHGLPLVVGIALAAILFYWSVRGIDWREVGRIAAHADGARLTLGAALVSTALFLRACRWRILLNTTGSIGVSSAFWATAAGYFANNFLPGRAGELVRTFMISSRSELRNAFVLATALADRFADAIALLIISAVVMLSVGNAPGWLGSAVRPAAIAGIFGILLLALLPLLGGWGRRLVDRMPLSESRRARLTAQIAQVVLGVEAFHDLRRLFLFVVLTGIIWLIDAYGAVITAAALGLHLGAGAALLLIAGLGLGSALPSTPGYVGVYQFVAVTVLTPFGFSRTDAIAFILVAQALMYVVIVGWGTLGFVRYRRARRSA
jgi:glycosyltransferase 2 family protein